MKKITLFFLVTMSCLVLNSGQSLNADVQEISAVSNVMGYAYVDNRSSTTVEVEFYNLSTYQSTFYTLNAGAGYGVQLPVGEYDIHLHPVNSLWKQFSFQFYYGSSFYSSYQEVFCYSFVLDASGCSATISDN